MGRNIADLLRVALAFVAIWCAYQVSACVWQLFAEPIRLASQNHYNLWRDAIWIKWWLLRAVLLPAPWPFFIGLTYMAFWWAMTPEEKEQERQWKRRWLAQCRLERMMTIRSSMNARMEGHRIRRP